jgi:KDO2-lipid IV(A) lauroyltransferase
VGFKAGKLPLALQMPLASLLRLGATPLALAGHERSARWMRSLARVYPSVQPGRFARAINNLHDAYPEWSDEQVRACALGAYEHLFQLASEFMSVPRLITHEACSRHVAFTHIPEASRALLSGGPTILITGHVGNWELIGYALAMLGFPMQAVYRPLDLKPLDDWVFEQRRRRGLTLVPKRGALTVLPDALRAGEPVGLVADQSGGDRGLFVPFFGRLTSTYKSIGLLAMHTRARLVCGVARRMAPGEIAPPGPWMGSAAEPREMGRLHIPHHGLRYAVELVDVFGPEDWEGQPDPLFYLTARYRRAIERMVRRVPDQYFWMHRVWRSRPAHERNQKPFPPHLREKLLSLPWMSEQDVERVVDRSNRDATELTASGAHREK